MDGIETFIMNIYRNIDKNKIQFDFAVHTQQKGEFDDEIIAMGGNIYYFPSRNKGLFNYIKTWKKFLRENAKKYNAIHMHVSSLTTILPIKLSKKYNINNRIVHAHNTCQKGIIHKILGNINIYRIKKYATNLFACSSEAGKYVFGNNKFELMHNGIDIQKYTYNEMQRKSVRKLLNLKENELAIVHVGRFAEEKNHEFLVDIFYEIIKANADAKLFLVGEGVLQNKIKDKVNDLKLSNKIIFLGKRNDINKLLNGMDIFIFPSKYEGLPVSLVEAQASGILIFASESISHEIKITDLIHFISLKEDAKEW